MFIKKKALVRLSYIRRNSIPLVCTILKEVEDVSTHPGRNPFGLFPNIRI